MKKTPFTIERDAKVTAEEIDDLREEAGWERFGRYDQVLKHSYTHFTVRKEERLIGFLNVLSDGAADAFLLDLLIAPEFQKRGIGIALMKRATEDLTKDGIQVTFAPELEDFYRKCGFHIFKAGIIDNKHRQQTC